MVCLVVAVAVAVGFVGGVAADQARNDSDDPPAVGVDGLSDADLRELSCRVYGSSYAEDGGFVDEDGDGYGWLLSDVDQRVLPWDEALTMSVDYCRETGPPHADDGDMDGIIDPLDPQTCFPGLPDEGPPPSGAPYCVELDDHG